MGSSPYNEILFSQKKKRNEVLIYATVQMDLENMMLSERNQTQKALNCDSFYMKCPEQTNL